MITIDTATVDDILEFSKNIRSMDAKEVEFVSGKPFNDHLGFLLNSRSRTCILLNHRIDMAFLSFSSS